MCRGPDKSKSSTEDMNNNLTVETEDSFTSMLELASNNDVEGFKRMLEQDPSTVDEVGLWYGRFSGSKQVVSEHRTPLMVAATYGSVDVLKLVLVHSSADVNVSRGSDKSTALHCAASGGSANVVDVVRLLLSAGADPDCVDANGHRPIDVVVVPPKLQSMRGILEELLGSKNASVAGSDAGHNLTISIGSSNSSSPVLTASASGSPPSPSGLVSSPMASKFNDASLGIGAEKKEYPIDPSLPDIKNSIYATDEFRMFSFKIRPCSRAYSHDWTECPFVHPGENARRRDPRKFHYSCVPCPDFRTGACRRRDMCEYAHGVFECWLHPAQYRTRLCKDGTSCDRRVCFFAHTAEELRPLYASNGSVVPSPRSSVSGASVMDMATALLLPGSPSSMSGMSPNPFSQTMSPSGNGNLQSSMMWPQPNIPTLSLPGSNFQSSRLRSSLNARDILPEDFRPLPDFESQQYVLNDLTCFSQTRSNSVSLSRSCRPKTPTPLNLEELFSAEISSSPRYSDQAVFSPTHKSAVLNQFQQPQTKLSPIKTNVFSPKTLEHPLLQASFRVGSPGRMSPRSLESISPMASRLAALAQREKQQLQLRNISSRDLGSNNPIPNDGSPRNVNSSWSKWGSPTGKLDWSINGDELELLRRSSSCNLRNNNREEPDVSWVQSLVKESPPEMMKEKSAIPVASSASSGKALNSSSQADSIDHSVIGAWLEQMQLDQLEV